MALSAAKLQDFLASCPPVTTTSAAATNLAQAYALYAADARDAGGNACTTLAASEAAMRTALMAMQPGIGTPAQGAAAFGAAFVAFWTGAAFATSGRPAGGNVGGNGVFGVVASSQVAAVDPAPLQATLTAFGPQAVAATALQAFAQALHVATVANVTVLTSGTDTSSPPVPVTHTGGLS